MPATSVEARVNRMEELAELETPIATVPPLPRPGRCRWPRGEPGQVGFRWCGSKAAPGKPYCRRHVTAARERVVKSPRRAP